MVTSNTAFSPPTDRLRAIVDIGPAVHQRAGLSRYTERLVSHLLPLTSDRFQLTLVYNRHSGHRPPASIHGAATESRQINQRVWRLGILASQLLSVNYGALHELVRDAPSPLVHNLAKAPAVYHATEHLLPRLPCPAVLTVHDLIFEQYPQHHTRVNRLFLKIAMPLFVRNADAIIAVSAHTKSDLILHYGTPGDKIQVIHEGIDQSFEPAPDHEVHRVTAHYSPTRPYLLMVGTLEPRKNHATALRALAILRSKGYPHQLLIVGPKGWLFEPVRRLVADLDLEDSVSFAGYVPGDDLPALYTGASCLLYPALYEGFGFPVLEAMACATPVVCSNTSSLPEIAGDAALLVRPTDAVALSAAVQRVLDNQDLSRHLGRLGISQAARFRWDVAAIRTLDLYARLAL